MTKPLDSVKRVVEFLEEHSEHQHNKGNASLGERLSDMANNLRGVEGHISELERLTSALPADLGNIHDLPQDLLDELSVAKTDELEDQLVTVINAYGGEASLDQILVGLYRKFGVVQKRRFVQNKLYRMKGTVWNVEGRKGIYTTVEPHQSATEPSNGETSTTEFDDEIPF